MNIRHEEEEDKNQRVKAQRTDLKRQRESILGRS